MSEIWCLVRCMNTTYMQIKSIVPWDDAARIKWERELWKYLQKVYYSCYKTHLPDYPNPDGASLKDLVVGWQYEQLFDIINYRINIAKAIDKLYKKTPAGGRNT